MKNYTFEKTGLLMLAKIFMGGCSVKFNATLINKYFPYTPI